MTNVYVYPPKNPIIPKTHTESLVSYTPTSLQQNSQGTVTDKTPTRHVIAHCLERLFYRFSVKTSSQNPLWMARYGHFIIENPAHAVLCTHQISEITPSHLAHTFYDTIICKKQKKKKKKKKAAFNIISQFWNVGKIWNKKHCVNKMVSVTSEQCYLSSYVIAQRFLITCSSVVLSCPKCE